MAATELAGVGGGGGERFMAQRARAWVAAARAAAVPAAAAPIIDLAADDLDRAAAPHIIQATIDALDRGETHYTDRAGIAPLRAAVAARAADEDGLAYEAKGEVLICGGGREALFVVTQMLVEPGDEVLVLDPAPVAYAEGVRLAGGIPILVPTRPEDGFALKAEAVLARLTPRSRVLLVASPAAPTGGVIAGADLAALADLARRYNLQVIWDETYRDYRFDGGAHEQIAALPGMRERTVIVGSFSTRYAMSGWRAGYVLGPAHLLRPVALMKQSLTICSPAPTQWAALAALTGPQRAIGEAVREATLRRAAALRALAALGLTCGGTGTPYLFIDLRGLGVAGRDFAAAALRDARVRLAPGEDYGPSGAGFVRLTLSAPVAVLESAIGRLAPVVARFRGEVGQKGGL